MQCDPVYVHVYVYVCVCTYVCVYVCVRVHVYVCIYVHTQRRTYNSSTPANSTCLALATINPPFSTRLHDCINTDP